MTAPIPHFCPSCGHNFHADAPVIRGDWDLRPHEAFFRGRRVNITGKQAGLLHTVAAAKGRAVRAEAIGARISDTDNPERYAQVVLCQMRKRIDAPWPIENVFGQGYRWMGTLDEGVGDDPYTIPADETSAFQPTIFSRELTPEERLESLVDYWLDDLTLTERTGG